MSADLLAIGVDAALENCAHYLREEQGLTDAAEQIEAVRAAFSNLRAAAHACLTSIDFQDQYIADANLAMALAACEPTDTDHNREAVDGLCVEENDDAR